MRKPPRAPKWKGGRPKGKTVKVPFIPDASKLPLDVIAQEIATKIRLSYGNYAACRSVGFSYDKFKRYMRQWDAGEPSEDAATFCAIVVPALSEREQISVTKIVESDDPKVHLEWAARQNPIDHAPAAQRLKVGPDLSELDDAELVSQVAEAVLSLPSSDPTRYRVFQELKKDYEPIAILEAECVKDPSGDAK